MATMAQPAAVRIRRDRIFYTSMGVLIALVTVIGFARSYYLSGWFAIPDGTPPMTMLLHVHGAIFTAWVVLMVVQPSLVATRNLRLHRKLGYAGAAVAAAMVVAGNISAIAAMKGGFIGLGDPFVFYAIPFFAINSFAIAVALAIVWRNRPETHKRLILLANVGLLNAAIARIPLDLIQSGAPFTFTFLPNLITVAGIIYDWRTRGRVHKVWIWGGLLMLLSQIALFPIMGTAAWHGFAEAMSTLW
ncbi:MAG TPA: hypothetical protein VGB54_11590 [Allosphingosinicella sp.]